MWKGKVSIYWLYILYCHSWHNTDFFWTLTEKIYITVMKLTRKWKIKNSWNIQKLVRSESLKWCHKLRRSHSKMELYNIYSHKMAINTHYIQERTIVLYSQSKQKSKKKIWKTKFRKKNLSATFHIFSKCHFLSNGEGVCGQQAISGHPLNLHLTIKLTTRRRNRKKKNLKKKFRKKI